MVKHSISGWRRFVSHLLFIIYLFILSYLLFFSEEYGRTDASGAYHYNLVLFREIKRFYKYRSIIGIKAVLINLLGNIAAFIPFGFFLPLLWHKTGRFFLILLMSFGFSFAVESIQLVYKVGTFDVDDLFLNTLGGLAGYLLLQAFLYARKKYRQHRKGKNERKCREKSKVKI